MLCYLNRDFARMLWELFSQYLEKPVSEKHTASVYKIKLVTSSQFHQHFTSSFFPKQTETQTVRTEKLQNTFVQKAACKCWWSWQKVGQLDYNWTSDNRTYHGSNFRPSHIRYCRNLTPFCSRLGVNFTIILRAAFTHTDPKIAKKDSQLKKIFVLSGSADI